MKVIEHLYKAKNPLISFEIIPPKRGGNVRQLLHVLDDIVKYNPPFIDITSHAAEVMYEETSDGGMQMKVKRKRPGTLGLCALIQNKYNIDAVPHVLCSGFTREETEDFLIELHYLGIDNVLAVRGDDSAFKKPLKFGRSMNEYAVDLVKQINSLNKGKYIEDGLLDAEPMDVCVGVGGYPEKHFEAPNLATDIKNTKEKVDAGASYIVTQMFYSNKFYFNYVDQCKKEGISAPIIPGLKVITSKAQIKSIPKNFFIDIPQELAEEVEAAKPEHVMEVGVEWTKKQVEELLNKNVPAVHFYVMQNSQPIKLLMNKLKL
ncbi:MAG: methylenetetrahydrofolate reductase [NAD(P)H] [Stygiobacter sp. RIFOXYC12_FULL_38_8]|nr:MAG: methylenetetrahydrofolate reductase [NAD(P)H] [Stygiobacter sp. GWC2_38_9]OGU78072.1 MAG: methylenetetrahydrofolate reductase [NAD(P)H] [Stygiobacter sp. RIFOXYA12_FULL_38_9]OGV13925.1 MAG: methylenetetrahydrofolate reductase [NAD(P)H] [Stygiobacter sp. RIFOXYC2_FULL_38_25]OGV15415.1 MAG: methylenetetrahydrofolate reductase [NAD(P)H] [Stygiobacter sp. RIFOXYA2_FULL_38_8]OGV28231.1 MAG: methylenetetrahydrofolate reductase [NAD(P)H] [Stygiobacter sp. RIFOXYC12_FULL_38_8]OGV82629.1 MAG: m